MSFPFTSPLTSEPITHPTISNHRLPECSHCLVAGVQTAVLYGPGPRQSGASRGDCLADPRRRCCHLQTGWPFAFRRRTAAAAAAASRRWQFSSERRRAEAGLVQLLWTAVGESLTACRSLQREGISRGLRRINNPSTSAAA